MAAAVDALAPRRARRCPTGVTLKRGPHRMVQRNSPAAPGDRSSGPRRGPGPDPHRARARVRRVPGARSSRLKAHRDPPPAGRSRASPGGGSYGLQMQPGDVARRDRSSIARAHAARVRRQRLARAAHAPHRDVGLETLRDAATPDWARDTRPDEGAVARMKHLIEDLLTLSRLESAPPPPPEEARPWSRCSSVWPPRRALVRGDATRLRVEDRVDLVGSERRICERARQPPW